MYVCSPFREQNDTRAINHVWTILLVRFARVSKPLTVLSMRRSRLRSPTRPQVCSASTINCAGRLVIYHEWRLPED